MPPMTVCMFCSASAKTPSGNRSTNQAIEADPSLTRLTADAVNDADLHAACLAVVERSNLSEEQGAAEFRSALAAIRQAEQRLAPTS